MRPAATLAGLGLGLIAAAFASGGHDTVPAAPPETPVPAATPPPPSPPAPVSMPAPPAPVSAPAPAASPAPLAGAIDCPVKREWTARILPDHGPFRVQWRECGAPQPLDVPPQQIAMWAPGVSELAWGLENVRDGDRLLIEKVETVDLDADGLQELLVVMRHEGTGGYMEWCLAGRKGDGIGCWDMPDLEAPAMKLLRADEDFVFRGWQVRPLPRGLRLERSVYRKGVDPNCCPTRGSVVMRLVPGNGRMEIAGITRRPSPRQGG